MEHTDEETLALMAMGETAPSPAAEHLRDCPHCARELEELRRVVSTLRTSGASEQDLLTPPPDLWDSIADELGLAAATAPAGVRSGETGAPSTRPPRGAKHGAGVPGAGGGVTGSVASSRPPRSRRLGRFGVMLAACAALLGAAAGSGVTWWATQDSSTSARPSDDGKRLDSLQPSSAGYARLSGSSGHRTLDITVKGLPPTSGYFEVWLMDRTHSKLVSMGVLGPDGHAALPVPQNIDLGEYSVVDVSVQPYNGSPDHSGDSLVRGPFAS